MNLEDSVGDIARKARTSHQVSVEIAAASAGVTPEAYGQFEQTGRPPAKFDFAALGRLLALDGDRLAAQVNGWRPAPVDLARWQSLAVFTTAGDDMTVNAFLAWDPDTKAAAIFDTGFTGDPIAAAIVQHGLLPQHLFITHSHPDHIADVAGLRRHFPGLQVHAASPNAPANQRLQPGDTWSVGRLQVAARATPGHAEDGITFVLTGWAGGASPVAVVGDALFAGSMGGARDQLKLAQNRVREEILSLPGESLICPGHGPLTTVQQELTNNPWFP